MSFTLSLSIVNYKLVHVIGIFYLLQIHSDFVMAATRAAIAVIDGNVMAINPGESSK